MRKLHQTVLRSVEGAFRSAKHQIANSNRLFELDDPLGLLVVLNPAIETFASTPAMASSGASSSNPSSG
jgi:hypothetical protein